MHFEFSVFAELAFQLRDLSAVNAISRGGQQGHLAVSDFVIREQLRLSERNWCSPEMLELLGRAFTEASHELHARKSAAAPKQKGHRLWSCSGIVQVQKTGKSIDTAVY